METGQKIGFYRDNNGNKKIIDVSDEACAQFGVYPGDIVKFYSDSNNSTIIGTDNGHLAYIREGNSSFACSARFANYDEFMKNGHKIVSRSLKAYKKSYAKNNGGILQFDISYESCKVFGFFTDDIISTPRGQAIVIGVVENNLWFHVHSDSGATCFTDGKNEEAFALNGYKLIYSAIKLDSRLHSGRYKEFYHINQEPILLDISNQACKPFGFFAGNRVTTTVGLATVAGVHRNELWFQFDDKPGIQYWQVGAKRDDFYKEGFKLVDSISKKMEDNFIQNEIKRLSEIIYSLAMHDEDEEGTSVCGKAVELLDPNRDLDILAKLMTEVDKELLSDILKVVNIDAVQDKLLFIIKNNDDEDLRLEAIKKIDVQIYGDGLEKIVLNDDDENIISEILDKLDPRINVLNLKNISINSTDCDICELAVSKIDPDEFSSILLEILKESEESNIKEIVATNINQHGIEKELADYAKTEDDADVFDLIVEKLKVVEAYGLIADIALTQDISDLQEETMQFLHQKDDEEIICKMAELSDNWQVRLYCLKKLDPKKHQEIITRVYENDSDDDVVNAAKEIIEENFKNGFQQASEPVVTNTSNHSNSDIAKEDDDEEDEDDEEGDEIISLETPAPKAITKSNENENVLSELEKKEVNSVTNNTPKSETNEASLDEIEQVKNLDPSVFKDEKEIIKLAESKNEHYQDLRLIAIEKLDSRKHGSLLEKIAIKDNNEIVRIAALKKFDFTKNKYQIMKIAEKSDGEVQEIALMMLDPTNSSAKHTLEKIAKKGNEKAKVLAQSILNS